MIYKFKKSQNFHLYVTLQILVYNYLSQSETSIFNDYL